MDLKTRALQKVALIVERNFRISRDALCIRFYRMGNRYFCDRILVERDGTESTQSVPFSSLEEIVAFLKSDPLYKACRSEFDSIALMIKKALNG